MQSRYYLEISRNVPNAGTQLLRVGLPVEREMYNDLCLCCRGSYDFIAVNSIVLRQALLTDPEKTKQLLGINVSDASVSQQELKKKGVNKK